MASRIRLLFAAFLLLALVSPASEAGASGYAGPLGVPAYSSFDVLDSGDPVQVRALSTRADLVSGGDVLIEVAVPKGIDLKEVSVSAAGRDVTRSFRPGGPGVRGLVSGLPLGPSTITAKTPAGTARLQVRNAPQGGPVFSGPLIQPWTCTKRLEEQGLLAAAQRRYSYKSSNPLISSLQDYDPANPPADVATTTTDEGNRVPFIVRVETGYSLRDQYRIAALWDPAQGRWPDPAAANPGFAHKLVLTHGRQLRHRVLVRLSTGRGVRRRLVTGLRGRLTRARQRRAQLQHRDPGRVAHHDQGDGGRAVRPDPLHDRQRLLRRFARAAAGGERLPRRLPGHHAAVQLPGRLGQRPAVRRLRRPARLPRGPVDLPEHRILPLQWPSIFRARQPGQPDHLHDRHPQQRRPSRSCPGVPAAQVYSASNPKGVRCSFQDYMRNVFGVDSNGKARRPISNVGIQYGLSGLLSGLDPSARTRLVPR